MVCYQGDQETNSYLLFENKADGGKLTGAQGFKASTDVGH
jgi:hypothetical protein